jgi:hypothetical protein
MVLGEEYGFAERLGSLYTLNTRYSLALVNIGLNNLFL